MTIAQLEQFIQQGIGFPAFRNLGSARRITFVFQNPIVPMSSKAVAEEYEFCLNHIPSNILAQATHSWALELSYAGRVPANHPMVAYLAAQLLGYRRTLPKHQIKTCLSRLSGRIAEFLNTPLQAAINQILGDLAMARFAEEGIIFPAVEQEAIAQPGAAAAADAGPVAEEADAGPVAEAADAAPARLLIADVINANPAMRAALGALMGRQRGAEPRMNFEEIQAQHQADIDRAIALSLNMPAQAAPQRVEKIPYKDVTAFCKTNLLFRWKMYDPTTRSDVVTYVDSEKARKIREILDAEPTEEQTTCHVCRSSEGVFDCGTPNCIFRMCGNCFFTWHLKNQRCPGCRSEYIPISLRPALVPVYAENENAGGNDDDE